ncbi:MAG: ABC transporter ATP-binding protein [Saprospiraceae bacterium]
MTSFGRLLAYLGRYKPLVAAAGVSNLLTAVFTVVSIPLFIPFFDILFGEVEAVSSAPEAIGSKDEALAWLNYYFSQIIAQSGRETALTYVCVFIIATFLLKNLFRYLALFFMAPVRNGIIRDLRAELYERLLHLPMSYYNEERKGDLMARMTNDVQEVEASILNVLESVFREPFILLGALGIMVWISPSLTGFVFVLMLFTGVVIGGIGKRLKRSSAVVQARLGDIVSRIEESLGGLRIIKGFGAEQFQERQFAEMNNDFRRKLTRVLWRRDLSSPLTEFLGIATVACLLWYGSRQVFSGELDASTFLAFIFAFYQVIDPAKNLSKAYNSIQKGVGAMERVEHILDLRNPLEDRQGDQTVTELREAVRLENISFRYLPGEPDVLRDVSITIPKGKLTALVGSSGAGKSTIADLLPRFYDVTGGRITIDGTDLRDLRLADLRGLFGIVSQEAVLFNDTIYNNIVFGHPAATPALVEQAARVANAHDFITATDAGYQTNIGDRGGKLSGGQRQRLTLARAVLRDPQILILDEATSALDSESERLVQDALTNLMRGRTAVVIAHRLSTIRHADEIVVLNSGRVVERGRHDELLALGGEYAKLVALQGLE